MEIQFLGGGGEVGRLAMLLSEGGHKYLFDYGFNPSKPPEYPFRAPPVDAVFVSHSHVDHCGMVPTMADSPDTEIIATSPTISTSTLLQEDSIRVGEAEGTPPPYNQHDVRSVSRRCRPVHFGETENFGGLEITCHPAGHIPGATMFEINARETILFTGDLHTIDTELVSGADPIKCDTLIIEGTYSGRDHPDRLKTSYQFVDKIQEVLDRGGTAVLPAFAVGRTQELLMILLNQRFDIWLDGMGQKVNNLYLGEGDFLRSPKKYRKATRYANIVRNRRDRERALGAEVIITTSGMLDGGPVHFYLSRLASDPKNAVLITGYQVEGSNGRRLMDTGTIELSDTSVNVAAEVSQYDFSAHAGHRELVRFIEGCQPKRVVFMHSDDPSALVNDIKGMADTVSPANGQVLQI